MSRAVSHKVGCFAVNDGKNQEKIQGGGRKLEEGTAIAQGLARPHFMLWKRRRSPPDLNCGNF